VGLLNFGIAIGSTVSVIIVSVILVGSNPICDTRLAANQMSTACVDFIWYTFLIGLPVLKLISLIIVIRHPIKGERLVQLYQKQGEHHQIIDDGGGGGGDGSGSVEVTTVIAKIVKDPPPVIGGSDGGGVSNASVSVTL